MKLNPSPKVRKYVYFALAIASLVWSILGIYGLTDEKAGQVYLLVVTFISGMAGLNTDEPTDDTF